MTWFLAVVAAAFLILGLYELFAKSQQNREFDAEMWRIEQVKQTALDDIHRRSQYAQDQLRRLARWSR